MIFDLHNDYPTVLDPEEVASYAKTFDAEITAAIWTSESETPEQRVRELTDMLLGIPETAAIAVEDIGFTAQNGLWERFDFSAYLYCSLTWNFDNSFAGGAHGTGRLTSLGKRVINKMTAQGCYVDVAHLNKNSFYDVVDYSDKILCSHTGFNDNARSLDNEQISLLVSRKAVLGLCTVSAFTGAKTFDGFVDVIDKFVFKYGDENLALGTDFNGSTDIPSAIDGYGKLNAVAIALEKRGYSSKTVDKIFYKNAKSLLIRR